MRSSNVLRLCMQGLVLTSVLFVHLTEVASMAWLVPLYVFTLAAPLLAPLRESKVYRQLWNLAVIGFFVVLFRHAMGAQLAYVLQDGLILAVLCQVHLLNNLRSEQRPDLLFFNAFLIAIITGFLTRELAFAATFAAFVPLFLVGQQLLCATREGRDLEPAVTRKLLVDGTRRAGLLLALTLLVFLFWPRDFKRGPLFKGQFNFSPGKESLELGFNDRIDPRRRGPVRESDKPVMRVTLRRGAPVDVPALWRGATLGATGGGTWSPLRARDARHTSSADEAWRKSATGLVRSGGDDPRNPRVSVERLDLANERLFTPLGARALRLGPLRSPEFLRGRFDGTVDFAEHGALLYDVSLSTAPLDPRERGGSIPARLSHELRIYAELPESSRTRAAIALAEELAPDEAIEQHRLVERYSSYLANTFLYEPPGSPARADSLEAFLNGRGGGHCELFASALATMLRSRGVPCRVVSGYRNSDWNDAQELLFTQNDAHAWVEVHDPKAGWYAVDPSPAVSLNAHSASLWARFVAASTRLWSDLTDFDAARRADLFGWIASLPDRTGAWARRRPWHAALALVCSAASGALLLRRLGSRTRPPIRLYLSAVRKAGLQVEPGETPRELLARARTRGLANERIQALVQATEEHERSRYAA